ncbi:MAG: N-acetylmuramoyl-L-alanine amidase [Saprospiraceae bacterium]|nr:N-acetylmuramoyl-L-alanine amidase [Saprospiraceae bacterium]
MCCFSSIRPSFVCPAVLAAPLLLLLLCYPVARGLAQRSITASAAVSKKKEPAPIHLKVLAQPGDDVPTLLQRYHLDGYECNVSEFFKINNLKEDYRLKVKTAYKIPVQVFTYNGKSIRTTLGIDDWQTAIRIDAYNKTAVEKGLRVRTFLEDKELWVPWHELHCPAESELAAGVAAEAAPNPTGAESLKEITAAKGNRVFPIFGKNYEKTSLVSRKLQGKVYYIISGHGGPDGGAEGMRAGHSLCEDEYAYDVSLRLVRLLVSHGATAFMIVRDPNDGIRDDAFLRCDKDEQVWGDREIPLDQKARLGQRTELINQLTTRYLKAGIKDQTIIEIHVDSRHRHQETDVFFYYRPDSETSKALALKFHNMFLRKYAKIRSQKQYNGTVSARSLFTLRETITPLAVYIELGNIRNDWDQQRLVIPNNRQALANWLCAALLAP